MVRVGEGGGGGGGGATTTSSESVPPSAAEGDGSGDGADDAVEAQLRVYESWFPPMRSVLRVLSKIFRVVEPRVFEDIALQSVQSCTRSLKGGAEHVLRKSGTMHADLFLVKHLLILREQLSPFDIQLRSVERQLDFSEAGKAVTRFLANRNRRLFAMSSENALVTLLREGVSVRDSSVDSKRDLDDALRGACNDFIENTSNALAGLLLLLVEQCKSASQSTDAGLKSQPFMRGDKVLFVAERTAENLPNELRNATDNMALYLENPATQSILLKPVVRKITRALDEGRRFAGEAVDGEFEWDPSLRATVLAKFREIETTMKGAMLALGRSAKSSGH
uniref:Conserved oligomeric Golgi complex subunit 3 C-terminal domain-containing protein n=1 Tax=Trieres chinensis TaxID=1514140 RepID=A0A7S1YZ74_TRICV